MYSFYLFQSLYNSPLYIKYDVQSYINNLVCTMHDGFFLHIALFNTLFIWAILISIQRMALQKINFLYLQMARHA